MWSSFIISTHKNGPVDVFLWSWNNLLYSILLDSTCVTPLNTVSFMWCMFLTCRYQLASAAGVPDWLSTISVTMLHFLDLAARVTVCSRRETIRKWVRSLLESPNTPVILVLLYVVDRPVAEVHQTSLERVALLSKVCVHLVPILVD